MRNPTPYLIALALWVALGLGVAVPSPRGAHASPHDLTVEVRDAAGAPLEHAVVALRWLGEGSPTAPDGPPAARERSPAASMDQRDAEFVPHVLPVRRGTRVAFPNSDNVRHHVYSFSPAKTFELKLYHGLPPREIEFDRAGEVVLGCNIHDHMVGYIYVLDTPFFAVTDADGRARIVGLPEGPFELSVQHPRARESVRPRRVEIADTEASRSIEVELAVDPDDPEPSTRVPPPRAEPNPR